MVDILQVSARVRSFSVYTAQEMLEVFAPRNFLAKSWRAAPSVLYFLNAAQIE